MTDYHKELAEMLDAVGIKTGKQVDALIEKVADLKIQAMMFDMAIDIETWSLVPKRKDTTPAWVKRWEEKRSEADFDERFDLDWE